MRKEIRYGEIEREEKNLILDCAPAGSTWLFLLPLVQYKNLETFGKYSGDCVNNTEFNFTILAIALKNLNESRGGSIVERERGRERS